MLCQVSAIHHAALFGLNGWEKWSYAAAVLLVLINAGFLAALLWQIKIGRQALSEAKHATDTSDRAIEEAEHARIDAQAPRVIVEMDRPEYHGLDTPGDFTHDSNQQYVLPRQEANELYFLVEGEFINDGKSSARIRMTGAAHFDTELLRTPHLKVGPITAGHQEEYLLLPGKSIHFSWSVSHTLKDWADAYHNPVPPNPHGACFMEVIVTDDFAEGVVDHIYLEMSGRPIQPIEGDGGRWRFSGPPSMVATSYPIVRTYRHEGQEGLEPSWIPIYKEWEELHKKRER